MRMWSTGRRRGAFTLVELLVVVATIIILSGAVVVQFGRRLPSTRLRTETRRVAATAVFARAIAVARCRRVRMEFNLDENAYALFVEPEPVMEPGIFAPIGRPEGALHELPEGVSILGAQNELDEPVADGYFTTTFWRDGSAEKTVLYLGAGEDVHTVVIQGSTGLVRTFDFAQDEIAMDDLDLDENAL